MHNLPEVFVGCSREGEIAAKAIQNNLRDTALVTLWTHGFFQQLTRSSLETLLNNAPRFDFAVFLLLPDDITNSRGKEQASPRDNTIFEAGIFLGILGQDRVFFVQARDTELKILSDLSGITTALYNRPTNDNWESAIGPATNQLERAVKTLGLRKRQPKEMPVSLTIGHETELSLQPPAALKRGNTASQTLVGLVESNKIISSLTLVTYKVQQSIDERLSTPVLRDPDALLNETSVNELLRQDQSYDRETQIDRAELTTTFLDEFLDKVEPGFAVALSSKIQLIDGSTRHLAMMDFRCRPSPEQARSVKIELTRRVGQPNGILLNSGRSFHFYGLKLLSEEGLRVFLAKCLLLESLVDGRYIGHRLRDGACRLRISPTDLKPHVPLVIDYF